MLTGMSRIGMAGGIATAGSADREAGIPRVAVRPCSGLLVLFDRERHAAKRCCGNAWAARLVGSIGSRDGIVGKSQSAAPIARRRQFFSVVLQVIAGVLRVGTRRYATAGRPAITRPAQRRPAGIWSSARISFEAPTAI